MQPVSDRPVADEEVPGAYTGSGLRNTESRFCFRCGNTFHRHVNAVTRAICATGPYITFLEHILYNLQNK